jgi:type II secretory pathway component PulF
VNPPHASTLAGPAIEYRSEIPPPRRLFSWPVLVVSGGIVALLFGAFGVVFPRLRAIYADFGMHVPALTQLLLDASWLMRWRGLIVCASIPLALGFLMPFILQRRKEPVTREQKWIVALLISNILLGIALLLVIIVWVIPMYELFNGYFHYH